MPDSHSADSCSLDNDRHGNTVFTQRSHRCIDSHLDDISAVLLQEETERIPKGIVNSNVLTLEQTSEYLSAAAYKYLIPFLGIILSILFVLLTSFLNRFRTISFCI